jgi:hypothetical protein
MLIGPSAHQRNSRNQASLAGRGQSAPTPLSTDLRRCHRGVHRQNGRLATLAAQSQAQEPAAVTRRLRLIGQSASAPFRRAAIPLNVNSLPQSGVDNEFTICEGSALSEVEQSASQKGDLR